MEAPFIDHDIQHKIETCMNQNSLNALIPQRKHIISITVHFREESISSNFQHSNDSQCPKHYNSPNLSLITNDCIGQVEMSVCIRKKRDWNAVPTVFDLLMDGKITKPNSSLKCFTQTIIQVIITGYTTLHVYRVLLLQSYNSPTNTTHVEIHI